jgi:hypothetical protein
MNGSRWALISWAAIAFLPGVAAAGTFSFVPGDYYVNESDSTRIVQYDSSGKEVGLLVDLAQRASCAAFGPDNLMYVFSERWPWDHPSDYTAEIRAYNSLGQVAEVYPVTVTPQGDDIVFDNAGHFYFGMLRFDIGVPDSQQTFFADGKAPFQVLPGGGFMALDRKGVYELTGDGKLAREVFRVTASTDELSAAAFDPLTGSLFVSGYMKGHGGYGGGKSDYGIWKIDAGGNISPSGYYTNFGDLNFTSDGFLLACGRATEDPVLFTKDLVQVMKFPDVNSARYMTQFVPEPTGWVLMGLSAVGLFVAARPRQGRSVRRP